METTKPATTPAEGSGGAEPPTSVTRPDKPATPAKKRSRVLLVDDSEPIHRLVRAWLKHGCEVSSAYRALEAIRIAVDGDIDLILLDVDMPEMDGFECCRLLKGDPRTTYVPVIFLTAAANLQEKLRGFEVGAVDYIVKPFNPAEFQARVQAALRTKAMIDQLADRSRIDLLTGLRSRGYVDERIPSLVSQAKRTGRVFSCLVLDIDRFKAVNDQYGHEVGDATLRRLAELLRETCREEDIICRFGGEEFIVITPDVGERGAGALATRIVDMLHKQQFASPDGTDLHLTCSIGVAAYDPATADDVVRSAENALYAAKAGGKDRIVLASAQRPAA